jgi:hypothetical protein
MPLQHYDIPADGGKLPRHGEADDPGANDEGVGQHVT